MQKSNQRFRLRKSSLTSIIAIMLVGLLSPMGRSLVGLAQSSEPSWSDPVNLSKSGSTRDPSMVVDSEGTIHVVWHDDFGGMLYSRNDGGGWSIPQAIEFPFEFSAPRFLADRNGNIAAFWIDEQTQFLLYSYIPASIFDNAGAWASSRTLADSLTAYDIDIDASGGLQVLFLRTEEDEDSLPGIYHLKAGAIGGAWGPTTLIYSSSYLRALTVDTGHVDIASTQHEGTDLVYSVWDDRSTKKVFLAISSDGGDTWGDPQVIDAPSTTSPTADPFRIMVSAKGASVDLVWDSGLQSGVDCTQYYLNSQDMGNTWGQRQVMLNQFVGCPSENLFHYSAGGLTLLQTTLQDEVYLMAWNGNSWSLPQSQNPLFSFVDAENFDTVNFRCRQTMLWNGTTLYVVGCDTLGDGDIWFLTRELGDVTNWFPPASNWSDPVVVTSDRPQISPLAVTTDPQGRFHVFWSQKDQNASDRQNTSVYYSRLDRDGWQSPVRVFSSPDVRAGRPSVAVDQNGRLIAVWGSFASGELFFTWANAAAANNPSEWVDPIAIPALQKSASSPVVVVGTTGTVYVAYVLQVNEERGIYLVSSSDNGENWSSPIKIFDAQQAGWSLVGRLNLGMSADGKMFALWERVSLPGDTGVISLYSSHSEDAGVSWTPAQVVTEASIAWSDIKSGRQPLVYRFWMGESNDVNGLWYELSTDGGLEWNSPENLTRLGETMGPTSLSVDSDGALHLLQVVKRDSEGQTGLNQWDSNKPGWNPEGSLELADLPFEQVTDIASAVAFGNRLSVVYAVEEQALDGSGIITSIYYTGRQIDASAILVPTATEMPSVVSETQTIEVTPTVSSTVETPPTNTPEPTQAATPTNQPPPLASVPPPGNSWGGLVLGLAVAAAIIVTTFGLVIWRARRYEHSDR